MDAGIIEKVMLWHSSKAEPETSMLQVKASVVMMLPEVGRKRNRLATPKNGSRRILTAGIRDQRIGLSHEAILVVKECEAKEGRKKRAKMK